VVPVTLEKAGRHLRLLSCPLCSHEFAPHESRSSHFDNEHDADDVPALAGPASGGGARAD